MSDVNLIQKFPAAVAVVQRMVNDSAVIEGHFLMLKLSRPVRGANGTTTPCQR